METIVNWLLEGPPYIEYQARLHLLGQTERSTSVKRARQAMLQLPEVKRLIAELSRWPVASLNSHKSAGHPIHKLTFLADLGLRKTDPGIGELSEKVMGHASPEGPFEVLMNISPSYGGTGADQWSWALCDAPLLVYSLECFGFAGDSRVRSALDHLLSLVRDNGWPCAGAATLGKFRGPGRKDDPCPFANLAMLKALSRSARADSREARLGTESILARWAGRRGEHPYMFFMGTDFSKPKAPLVWYDILHVLFVLTEFRWTLRDPRLLDMAQRLESCADADRRLTPKSVWKAWEGWEFAQKKEPSRWVTLLAARVARRLSEADGAP